MAIPPEPSHSPYIKEEPQEIKTQTKEGRNSEKSPLKSPTSKKRKTGTNTERWTDEQSKLLINLRQRGHSFAEICEMKVFPGRTKRALELQGGLKKREMTEIFTEDKDKQLREEYEKYEKNVWNNIGCKIGMSAGGCKKRAAELGLVRKG